MDLMQQHWDPPAEGDDGYGVGDDDDADDDDDAPGGGVVPGEASSEREGFDALFEDARVSGLLEGVHEGAVAASSAAAIPEEAPVEPQAPGQLPGHENPVAPATSHSAPDEKPAVSTSLALPCKPSLPTEKIARLLALKSLSKIMRHQTCRSCKARNQPI